MSALLFARAAALGGVFSTADATALAVHRNELRSLVRSGAVVRVGPRAHVLASTLAEATSPEAVHRLETLAVLRSFDNRVAASHHSALALHRLPFWRVRTEAIHVCRVAGRSSRVRGRVHIHEAQTHTPLLVSKRRGELTTGPALAAVGTAMEDGIEAGVVAMDAALHRRMASREEFESLLTAMRSTPDITRARQALAHADDRSESPGETLTRLVLRSMPGLPSVLPQVPFHDDSGHEWARGDFGVGEHLVVEFDGRQKYRAGNGATSREVEDIVWAEKRREDRIRSAGFVVVRLVWSDVLKPSRARWLVRRGLDEARRLYGSAALADRQLGTAT